MFVPIPVPMPPMYTPNQAPTRSVDEDLVYSSKKIQEKLVTIGAEIDKVEKRLSALAFLYGDIREINEKLSMIRSRVESNKLYVDRHENAFLFELKSSVIQRLKKCEIAVTQLQQEYRKFLRGREEVENRTQSNVLASLCYPEVMPAEILTKILDALPLHKKIPLRAVSRQWRDVIDNTPLSGVVILPNTHGKEPLLINTVQSTRTLKLRDLMLAINSIRRKHKWFQFGVHQSLPELLDKHFRKVSRNDAVMQPVRPKRS